GEMNFLQKAERFTVRFEAWDLPCYSWGEGPTVLLCHGWGSRAGHLALLARALAQAGFRAVVFDAPAHYSLPVEIKKEGSSMFEFGQAIALVARSLGELHGLFGHSLGAMAAIFAMAAYPHLEDCSFACPKLALASAPATTRQVLANFCRTHSLGAADCRTLAEELESEFSMSIDDYDCAAALAKITSAKMIVQGADDEYFAFADTLAGTAAPGSARVLIAEKCGHNRVLANKQVLTETIAFFTS
ncbi:MAG TPA: alpha/beta hydrolase, partial [Candidatus Binatia bacterium]|nr:alpha/beta hydrolase [Candidatus Binatia bacterium]